MEIAALFFPIFVVFVFMSCKLFNSLRSMIGIHGRRRDVVKV